MPLKQTEKKNLSPSPSPFIEVYVWSTQWSTCNATGGPSIYYKYKFAYFLIPFSMLQQKLPFSRSKLSLLLGHFKLPQIITSQYPKILGPTVTVFPVFIMGRHQPITKWCDYSTFNIPTVVLKDIQQLWECQMYCNHPIMKTGITAAVGLDL